MQALLTMHKKFSCFRLPDHSIFDVSKQLRSEWSAWNFHESSRPWLDSSFNVNRKKEEES